MSIYTKPSHTEKDPLRFYVYAYLRSNDSKTAKAGTPYYIGKGTGFRAFEKHRKNGKGVHTPTDRQNIVFLERNLSGIGAMALERRMIKWWGRKNIKSGILLNKTDGGEGLYGFRHSEETLQKMSGPFTDKHIENMKIARNKNPSRPGAAKKAFGILAEPGGGTGSNNPFFNHKHSDKSLAKMKYAAENRERIICEHCGIIVDSANYGRWHGKNCRALRY